MTRLGEVWKGLEGSHADSTDSADYILTAFYTSWHKVKKEQSNKAKAKEKSYPRLNVVGSFFMVCV